MSTEFLRKLFKAGGAAAVSIGVLFVIYRSALDAGLFPQLETWQAFALLCLLLVLVFSIGLATLWLSRSKRSSTEDSADTSARVDADSR